MVSVPEPKIVLGAGAIGERVGGKREALIGALDQEILRTFRWRRLLLFVPYVAMAQPLMELLKTRVGLWTIAMPDPPTPRERSAGSGRRIR